MRLGVSRSGTESNAIYTAKLYPLSTQRPGNRLLKFAREHFNHVRRGDDLVGYRGKWQSLIAPPIQITRERLGVRAADFNWARDAACQRCVDLLPRITQPTINFCGWPIEFQPFNIVPLLDRPIENDEWQAFDAQRPYRILGYGVFAEEPSKQAVARQGMPLLLLQQDGEPRQEPDGPITITITPTTLFFLTSRWSLIHELKEWARYYQTPEGYWDNEGASYLLTSTGLELDQSWFPEISELPDIDIDKAFAAIVAIAFLRKGNLGRPRAWLQAEKKGRKALSGIDDLESLINRVMVEIPEHLLEIH
jgi:hypothetical protein